MTRVAAVADHAPGHAQSSPSREERLLELCLGSPSARPRPSSAPAQRRARQDATCGRKVSTPTPSSKTSKRPTSACGVCGRPAAKKGLDLPLEWMRIYREPSNPKLGWCQKSQKGEKKDGEKGRPDAENAPKFRSSLGRRSSRIFQTQSEVDWLVKAWQKRVLACGRSLRLRQKSLVNFVDQVLAAGVSSPKGSGLSDTLKFEEDLDLEDFGGPSLVHAPITASRGSVRSVRASILKPACPQEAEKAPEPLDTTTNFVSAADRFSLNQIFGQLCEHGDLTVERVAEGLELLEGKGSDKEWVREILLTNFPGRLYLERGDFIDFVNLYRRHRHAFMVRMFREVDTDGSGTLSLDEIVVLLKRRGITPVMSCVERIFREVTGERELRDLSFKEFVQIYDLIQSRAGFSDQDLARLKKVWNRYDADGNQVLSVDELHLALDWQGFAVDPVEVERLALEVGRKKGLNQHEFLTFMRKYRDFEVQKILQFNQEKRRGDEEAPLEGTVSFVDLVGLLKEIGYTDVSPEVLQECAALVHLVSREMAEGIASFNPTFTFDGLYHFLENLRASHGFANEERVDLRHAFGRFSNEQFSRSGFIEEDDASSSAPEDDEEAQVSVLKLLHVLRWLGYQLELWQVVEKMDSIRMVGSAYLSLEEFLRIMAKVHQQEIDCIRKMLDDDKQVVPNPLGGRPGSKESTMSHEVPASDQADESNQITARRLKRVFHHWGYPMASQELVALSKEFAQGSFSQDVWGVAQVLRRHRKKVRELVRKNLGFHRLEVEFLQEAFGRMGATPPEFKLKGKMLSNVVRELFPGAERDQHERSRAHWMLKQVTKSQGNCEALEFQEFLHLVRLRLDLSTEARLQEEHRALEVLKFVPVEAAEWRIIFHKLARAEQSATTGGVLTQVSATPVLSYVAVEALVSSIAGECTESDSESLQEVLASADREKKGKLFFWEFLTAVRALMESNWHNINEEAQKLVVDAWAAKEVDALYMNR